MEIFTAESIRKITQSVREEKAIKEKDTLTEQMDIARKRIKDSGELERLYACIRNQANKGLDYFRLEFEPTTRSSLSSYYVALALREALIESDFHCDVKRTELMDIDSCYTGRWKTVLEVRW